LKKNNWYISPKQSEFTYDILLPAKTRFLTCPSSQSSIPVVLVRQ
jgi:hypothetical protein